MVKCHILDPQYAYIAKVDKYIMILLYGKQKNLAIK